MHAIHGKFDFRQFTGLSQTAKLVAETLDVETQRKFSESLLSTKRIAAAIGRGIRVVQLAFKELIAAGVIRVRRASVWKVRSGHVITLLWRVATLPFGDQQSATECASQAQPNSLDSAAHPIRVSDESSKDRDEDDPPPICDTERSKTPDPKVEQPASALVERAAKTLELPTADAARVVKDATARAPEGHVAAALDAVGRKKGKLRDAVSYFYGALKWIVAAGGPRPEPVPKPKEQIVYHQRIDYPESDFDPTSLIEEGKRRIAETMRLKACQPKTAV